MVPCSLKAPDESGLSKHYSSHQECSERSSLKANTAAIYFVWMERWPEGAWVTNGLIGILATRESEEEVC